MLNNKGFAVSTILYGILSLTIIILLLILGIMKSSKDMNQGLVGALEESMNECAISEAALENCYFNAVDCNPNEFYSCIGKEGNVFNYLTTHILNNNSQQSDSKIDFSSSTSGYSGLYYTSGNTENSKVTYYFRGNVNNNYVKFANHTWRIVRINEDGSIRLILNGVAGSSKFNSSSNDNTYVGYKYGSVNASSYALAHANNSDSNVKTFLDKWYEDNLKTNYSSYLVDSGFCGDRSVAPGEKVWASNDTSIGKGTYITYYGSYNRIKNISKPQFGCPNASNDLYTIGSKGNKTLKYPIGLLTIDEFVYAGGVKDAGSNTYLVNNYNWWTMSPYDFDSYNTHVWYVTTEGKINPGIVSYSSEIRPVINLRSTVEITKGIGTSTNPYIIKTS